jgi:Domain of unknown function (DUF4389)
MNETSSVSDDHGPSGPGGQDGSSGASGPSPPGGSSGPDEPAGSSAGSPPPPPPPPANPPPYPRPPFPWARLFYAIGFSFVAWAVFWVIVGLLAPLHYITIAITGRANEELQQMSLRATHYLYQLLGFVSGARDEKPFPLGPFPRD